MKRLVYLISPNKINKKFYNNLDRVLSFGNVKFFQLRLKKIKSKNLLKIANKINDSEFRITFSYGRGLQASALKEFGKNQENIENIQKAFNHRAKMNGLSSKGEWSENLEKETAA